ncbi:MAG: tetratricopeptide repeat protein [Gammaproteobacteria bacterium]
MAALYAVTAWLIMQVAEVVIGLALLPEWLGRVVLGVLAAGFPLAMALAWFYEITPEGLKRDTDLDRAEAVTHASGRRMDFVVIAVLAAAVGFFAFDKWWLVQDTEPSIAVLPFVNMSGDPAQEHLSDGISEELLHRLAQISELHVAARTSSFYFKGKDVAIPQIASELGVRAVLEGSIRKAGDKIRVTVQLINASDGYHIWSQTFDRQLDDIFAIQDEISSRVVSALRVSLLGGEQRRIKRWPTDSIEAYDAYLLGRQMMARRTSSSLRDAEAHFAEAIRLDPDFALAHVGLADTYALLGSYGGLDRQTVLAGAEPALERALALDDQLGEAYSSMGAVRLLQGDFSGSREAYQRAIELSPNYAPAYLGYGMLMKRGFGRVPEALELHQTALGLDPMSTPINMAVVEDYHELGRFEEVRERCQRVIEIDPDYPRAYTIMADLYWEVFGKLDEAVVWLYKAIELDPGNPDHARWLGMVYLDLGDFGAGERWMRHAMEMAPNQLSSLWAAIYLARYLGDQEQAVASAEAMLRLAPDNWLSLVVLRDADYRDGDVSAALERYREARPELLQHEAPVIDATNFGWAIEIANVLIRSGRRDRAEILLQGALSAIRTRPRLGFSGYGISDVEIHALMGDRDTALDLLATAMAEGWRSGWRIGIERNDNLVSLRGDPRYQSILANIETDMEAQLKKVNAFREEGLFPSP